ARSGLTRISFSSEQTKTSSDLFDVGQAMTAVEFAHAAGVSAFFVRKVRATEKSNDQIVSETRKQPEKVKTSAIHREQTQTRNSNDKVVLESRKQPESRSRQTRTSI